MPVTINASPSNGLVQTADGSGIIKVQSNGVTTNAIAWVNFNGTTSPGTIRSQYNVSSVTKNGTGDFTLNFTNAMPDVNYSVVGTCRGQGDVDTNSTMFGVGVLSTSSARVYSKNGVNNLVDSSAVNVAIFGN